MSQTISVIIPAYRRPEELRVSVEAIFNQTRAADEVLVIAVEGDVEIESARAELIKDFPTLKILACPLKGQVAQLNFGLEHAIGDIIAITDDDTRAHNNWLSRIEHRFMESPDIGAVGGKDIIYVTGNPREGVRSDIGRVYWFGKVSGYHNLGTAPARKVEHLRGANMSFRRIALDGVSFDTRLKGQGAQVYNDLSVCLQVHARGWDILFDPEIIVDHFHAERFENDKRGNFNWQSVVDGAHNKIVAVIEYIPHWQKPFFLTYALLVGTIFTPGVVQAIRIIPKEGWDAGRRFVASLLGTSLGLLKVLRE